MQRIPHLDTTIADRIRQQRAFPSFLRTEQEERHRYRHELAVPFGSKKAILRYRRSRWNWIGEIEGGVRKRDIFGWLFIENQRVAAVNLHEFKPRSRLGNDEFVLAMDTEDGFEGDMAETLASHWEEFATDVTRYGNLVDFRFAWSDPTLCPPRLWAVAANLLIQTEFPRRSLLTMKAFPLEFEHGNAKDPLAERALKQRQKAMCRHYKRLFNVMAFPGEAGAEGWLYGIRPKLASTVPVPNETNDA